MKETTRELVTSDNDKSEGAQETSDKTKQIKKRRNQKIDNLTK